jgi:DNA polymerase
MINIPPPASFSEWRAIARGLLIRNITPGDVLWSTDLRQEEMLVAAEPLQISEPGSRVPQRFLELGKLVSLHCALEKWALLYLALWRITRGERHLFELSSDQLVRQLGQMEKDVKRAAYKMQAFVRFRRVEAEGDYYVAWYEPEHDVIELAFPFFRDRFTNMRWSILTPSKCAHWDGEGGWFSAGEKKQDLPPDDLTELWVNYYRSTFNPARLKVKAMLGQMPKKSWKNLPETIAIPEMVRSADGRTNAMIVAARDARRKQ